MRREVLNDGRAWLEVPVRRRADDEPELLATYIAAGHAVAVSRRRLADAGRAPPVARTGALGRARRADAAAAGRGVRDLGLLARRRSARSEGWYVNFQEPFRRTADGLRHAGSRARHLGAARRPLGVEGRRAARAARRGGAVHGRAGRRDLGGRPPRRRPARRGRALVADRVGDGGTPTPSWDAPLASREPRPVSDTAAEL